MMSRTESARRWLAALAVLTLSLWLPSCEMLPADTAQGKAGITTEPGDTNAADAATPSPTADTPVGALIHRIDMPLDVSLDAAWAAVDEQAAPVLMHGMWQANGLRIGVLHAADAQAFAEALPVIHGESRAKLFTSYYPTAIRSTPRLIEPVAIDLTEPPRSPTTYRARDGRLQLLARIGRDESGQVWLELTPHHYKPKTDLVPRSPLEKALDGRVFNNLSAMLPVTPDTAIVVGLYRPWPEPDETEAEDEDAAEQAQEEVTETETTEPRTDQTPATSDQPSLPPIPDHLGKSLMTAVRAGKKIQIMMIISMIEDEPSPAAEGR
jgi:hypothetical protein